jgi:flagellar hook-associated protein 2
VVVVDGLRFTRTSNTISDALPGTTLTLTKENPGQAEDLVLSSDPDATQKRLQTFVDAYNGVMSLVRKQTNVTADTDRSTSLVGFSSIRSLQGQLQQVLVSKVPGLATVRTLADLGLKTSKDDGSLSIDATVLQRALARDPSAVNALFSTAVTGVSKLVDGLVDRNTRSVDGALVVSQDSLNGRVTQITSQIESMQRRVDAYRATLLAQFTAMETMVSGLKNMGTFLTSWASQGTKSS